MRIGKHDDVVYFGTIAAFSIYCFSLVFLTIVGYRGVLLIIMWLLLIPFYALGIRVLNRIEKNRLVTLKDNTFN